MPALLVLTCSSGRQCRQIIPLLYEQSSQYKLRLIVHSKRSLERLQNEYPKAEVVQANLSVPEECSQILDGATTIYYISPTFQTHEIQFANNIIDAAVAEREKPGSKFSHFVFSSVLHPEISKMLNHDRKRYIEEYLCESSLPYTILQPSHFADNVIGQLLSQKDSAEPVFMAAHDPNIAFSFTSLRDHAEVSVKVIKEREKHFFATYQLVSTGPIKYTEYIKSVGDVLGKEFQIKRVPYEQAVNTYCQLIFGKQAQEVDPRLRDGPERMLLYYNSRGLVANPGILEWLLGRPATSPAQLAKLMIETATGKSG